MIHSDAHLRENLLDHAGFVRSLARAALRGDAECEDLEQDVWQAALTAAPADPARQRPWLAGVIRRRAAELLRRRFRRERHERAAVKGPSPHSTADLVERAEAGRRLVQAVLKLDEPYRSAVLLRFQDGLPPREIAARQAVPVETVRSRVQRGLAKLRLTLSERERDEGRDARSVLLAIAIPREGAGPAGSAAPVLGGLLMAKKALVLALILVVIGLAGVAWRVLDLSPDQASDGPPDGAPIASEPRASSGETLAGAPSKPTTIPPTDIAAAERPLPPTGSVRGRVVGDDGKPIAGAVLRGVPMHSEFERDLVGSPPPIEWPTAVSDAEGRFEMPVPTGRYGMGMAVRVRADGWVLAAQVGSSGIYLSSNPSDAAATITLQRSVPLSVRVVDASDGRAIAGAVVASYRGRGYPVLYTIESDSEETTGADGVARIATGGGEVRVLARAPGFADAEGGVVHVAPPGASTTVRLVRGGTIVVEVVSPDGRPVPRARVALLRAPATHLRAVADDAGIASFEHVPAASAGPTTEMVPRLAIIAAEAEGYARSWLETEAPSEGGRVSVRLVLVRPRTVVGHVRTADGQAVADARVMASTEQGRAEWGWSGTGPYVKARADAQGAFALADVQPGRVTISAFQPPPPGRPAFARTKLTVDVPAEGPLAPLELIVEGAPRSPVRVHVVDADGRGVAGAAVQLIPVAGPHNGDMVGRLLTAADGTVAVSNGDGPWWMFVDAPGAGPFLRQVETAEAARGPIDVRPGSGRIEGRAVRLDGSPARVRLSLETVLALPDVNMGLAGDRGAVETDADGRFVFPGVYEGVTGVRSETNGLTLVPPAAGTVPSHSGVLSLVVADAAETATLSVTVEVVDAAGQALDVRPDVQVSRPGATGYSSAWAVPGSPVLFRSQAPIEPGVWHVRVEAKGYEPVETDVEVAAGAARSPTRVVLRKSR